MLPLFGIIYHSILFNRIPLVHSNYALNQFFHPPTIRNSILLLIHNVHNHNPDCLLCDPFPFGIKRFQFNSIQLWTSLIAQATLQLSQLIRALSQVALVLSIKWPNLLTLPLLHVYIYESWHSPVVVCMYQCMRAMLHASHVALLPHCYLYVSPI